jgi:hypothetical protein
MRYLNINDVRAVRNNALKLFITDENFFINKNFYIFIISKFENRDTKKYNYIK